jgi:hypothetical protein
MASLTDLFNPTFLMFLGILLLAIALLVLYFESKFRDQNHKITSMLSLVSSLAEEVNTSKMIINHLTMMGAGKGISQNTRIPHETNNLEQNINSELINVSDDEDEDDEDDNDDNNDDNDSEINDDSSDSDNEEDTNYNLEENTVIQIGEPSDIRVFKINISENDINDIEEDFDNKSNNLDILDELDELDDLDGSDSESSVENFEENNQTESLTLESKNNKELENSLFELKSINISSLEEEEEKEKEIIDFKKLTLNKLRNIATKKGLSSATDALKLKKNDLLKLLEIE